jgi:uncharacterized membrane protein (DUF4010 family)
VALFALSVGFAAWQYRGVSGGETDRMTLGNPVELGRAVVLALVFAGVLVVARAAQARLGAQGLLMTGLVGGLVDVDSVTVAAAQLRRQGIATLDAAGGSYLLATVSNLAMKAGIVVFAGGAPLARRVLPGFAAVALVTLGLLVFA